MALTYDIAAARLFGSVGGQHFSMDAVSGGGRGRVKGRPDSSFGSHLSTTQESAKTHVRGGPLPSGELRTAFIGCEA